MPQGVNPVTLDDDPEAYLNALKQTAVVAGWPEAQWAALPAQQAVNTLPAGDLTDYKKVRVAILQTFNFSPEADRRCFCEIEFGPDYHPQLIGQKIQLA